MSFFTSPKEQNYWFLVGFFIAISYNWAGNISNIPREGEYLFEKVFFLPSIKQILEIEGSNSSPSKMAISEVGNWKIKWKKCS